MNDYKKLKLIEERYFRKLPAIKLLIHSLVKVISKDNLNNIMLITLLEVLSKCLEYPILLESLILIIFLE